VSSLGHGGFSFLPYTLPSRLRRDSDASSFFLSSLLLSAHCLLTIYRPANALASPSGVIPGLSLISPGGVLRVSTNLCLLLPSQTQLNPTLAGAAPPLAPVPPLGGAKTPPYMLSVFFIFLATRETSLSRGLPRHLPRRPPRFLFLVDFPSRSVLQSALPPRRWLFAPRARTEDSESWLYHLPSRAFSPARDSPPSFLVVNRSPFYKQSFRMLAEGSPCDNARTGSLSLPRRRIGPWEFREFSFFAM